MCIRAAAIPRCSGFTTGQIGGIMGNARSPREDYLCPDAQQRCARDPRLCCDYKCSHLLAISGDAWPDDVRLSDIEPRFVCTACGKRGADVRPDFNWKEKPVAMMGYR